MAKKSAYSLLLVVTYYLFFTCLISCGPPKRGCKGDGANIGAERILSGEKKLKKSKFKIKGMQ